MNDINLYKNKYLAITDINNNINNESNIKNILVKTMTIRNKDYLKEKKDLNKNTNNQIDNILMAYSNNDLKNNNYYFKYKNKDQIINIIFYIILIILIILIIIIILIAMNFFIKIKIIPLNLILKI